MMTKRGGLGLCLLLSVFATLGATAQASDCELCGELPSTIPPPGTSSPCRVTCDISVSGDSPEIETGTVMEFERYKGLYVTGSLQATGVIFTSADPQPAPGDWSGIHFEATATGSLLQGCQVLYAGSDAHGGNVNISSPDVEIRNCTIAHSDWHGIVAVAEASLIGNTIEHNDYCAIHVTGDSSEILASGNSASNNEHNGICVEGAISADTHWCSNSPYVLYDDVAVGVDETLSICPGVTVEGTLYHGLTVSGALHALGAG